MKRITIAASLLSLAATLFAQQRGEIKIPDIDGYQTLKCDFHIHSVFSDGTVWPTVRVDEAYREGLDAIALTEHIEYRPHFKDIPASHNRSYEIAEKAAEQKGIILIKGSEITRPMAPGHFNVLFLTDSEALEQKEWRDAFNEAKKQNGFFFWNHPGWDRQQPDTTLWWPEHTELLEKGMMHGIEVANGNLYSPEALTWCQENNLTVMGTSDVHQPIQSQVDFAVGEHRSMTLVFATERTPKAIREALESRRTVAYMHHRLIGDKQYLNEIFKKAVHVQNTHVRNNQITLTLYNDSDLTFHLQKKAHDEQVVYFRDYVLKPHSTHSIRIELKNGLQKGNVDFEVTNLVVKPGKGLPYTIPVSL